MRTIEKYSNAKCIPHRIPKTFEQLPEKIEGCWWFGSWFRAVAAARTTTLPFVRLRHSLAREERFWGVFACSSGILIYLLFPLHGYRHKHYFVFDLVLSVSFLLETPRTNQIESAHQSAIILVFLFISFSRSTILLSS